MVSEGRKVLRALGEWVEVRLGAPAARSARRRAVAAASPEAPAAAAPVAATAPEARRAAPPCPAPDPEAAEKKLVALHRKYDGCTRCPLHKERTTIVFGQGSATARVMIVGEGPGAEEDRQGLAFVGRSGQLLTKMLAAIGLDREKDCFITNTIKCRPPGNRNPQPEEMDACEPILTEQIEIIRPEAIFALGNFAAERLLAPYLGGRPLGISKLRGRVYSYRGIPTVPSYHPAYLLRDPRRKKEAWEDLKRLRRVLDGQEGAEEATASTEGADEAAKKSRAVKEPAPKNLKLF